MYAYMYLQKELRVSALWVGPKH